MTKIKSWAKWAKRCENTLKSFGLDKGRKYFINQGFSPEKLPARRGLSKRAGLSGLNWAKSGLK